MHFYKKNTCKEKNNEISKLNTNCFGDKKTKSNCSNRFLFQYVKMNLTGTFEHDPNYMEHAIMVDPIIN